MHFGDSTEVREKALLFLGSGISYDSGMPSVSELTKTILSQDSLELASMHPFNSARNYDNHERVRGAQDFLKALSRYAESNGLNSTNYEDLHSLCRKIEHYFYAPRKDPTSRPLVEYSQDQIKETQFFSANNYSLQQSAACARQFIEYSVKHELLIREKEPVNLDKILEYADLLGPSKLDIVTLNHDTLIEELFKNRDDWTDGFGERENVFLSHPNGSKETHFIDYIADRTLFDHTKIRIIKPHGSCNWYQFSRQNNHRWGIPRSGFSEFYMDESGEPLNENPFEAGVLSGSLTKERSYLFWQTGYMFRHAYRIIHEYDRIICSGYGWKDFGINEMFIEWVQKSSQKRLLILEDDRSQAFQETQRLIENWTANYLDRSFIHSEWLSATNPVDALNLLKVQTRQ